MSVWVISRVYVPVVFGCHCQGFFLPEFRVVDHVNRRTSPAEDKHGSDVGNHTSQTDLWFCWDVVKCKKIRDFEKKNVWSTITGDDTRFFRNLLRLSDFENWDSLLNRYTLFFRYTRIFFHEEVENNFQERRTKN